MHQTQLNFIKENLTEGALWKVGPQEIFMRVKEVSRNAEEIDLVTLVNEKTSEEHVVEFPSLIEEGNQFELIYCVDEAAMSTMPTEGRAARLQLADNRWRRGKCYITHFISDEGKRYEGELYETLVNTGKRIFIV